MSKRQMALYLRFIKLLFPHRKTWFLIIGLGVLSGSLSLIIPFLSKEFIDIAIAQKKYRVFINIAVIAGGIYLITELMNRFSYWLQRIVKLKVNLALHKKVFKHLQGLSYGWFQDKSTGEHIFKINYDVDSATDFITGSLPEVLAVVPKAILILVIVFFLNWKLALCALSLAPFLFLPAYFFRKMTEKAYEKIVESSEEMLRALQETFSHIQFIKVWGSEKKSIRRFLGKMIFNIRLTLGYLRIEVKNGVAIEIITKLIIGLIAFYGGYLVIRQELSLGGLTAIMVYLTQLVGLQSQFAGFLQTNIAGTVSCERLARIFDTQPQIRDSAVASNFIFKEGGIEFKNVSFGYRPNEFVIKNLSFSIKGGKHLALVGSSGSGKTTILNLLVRLYDSWEGRISIDSFDIRSITVRSLKNQIGVALQEHFLWDDTIFNNISYCCSNASPEDVEEIARVAGVDDFVKALPLGFQSVIGENACKLSEGQKQKIAIARALFKRPKVLVLDEAMSAMDSKSEEKIISNIKERYKAMTVIIVSHRFSTIKGCDRALYLSAQDKIIEDSIEGLVKNSPDFRRLFAGQIDKNQAYE